MTTKMMISQKILLGWCLLSVATAVDVTRQECADFGGATVGDVTMDGAILQPDYVCESNNEPPLGTIVPGEGEPVTQQAQVCCGSPRAAWSLQECLDQGGIVTNDMGNGAIHSPDYICSSNGMPPLATVVPLEGEPMAREGQVCCGAAEEDMATLPGMEVGMDKPTMTRQECTDQGGSVVGDIGDGAIHREDYLCESNNEPPIGSIIPAEGEPIAIEGEVCCGAAMEPTTTSDGPPAVVTMSRQECTDLGGTVVGDIGDGAIFQAGYVCESNGEPPMNPVVALEGEPISSEGEVCCGPPAAVVDTTVPATTDGPTTAVMDTVDDAYTTTAPADSGEETTEAPASTSAATTARMLSLAVVGLFLVL